MIQTILIESINSWLYWIKRAVSWLLVCHFQPSRCAWLDFLLIWYKYDIVMNKMCSDRFHPAAIVPKKYTRFQIRSIPNFFLVPILFTLKFHSLGTNGEGKRMNNKFLDEIRRQPSLKMFSWGTSSFSAFAKFFMWEVPAAKKFTNQASSQVSLWTK